MRSLIPAALILIASTASAESLTIRIDPFDQESVLLADNAEVINGDTVFGWLAKNPLIQSQVIYHFELSDRIQFARLWSNSYFQPYPTQFALLSLSVSKDGTNWTDVAKAETSTPFFNVSVDATAPLKDSSSVYVRAQFIGEQVFVFRRYGPNSMAALFVETVPEPLGVMPIVSIAIVGCVLLLRVR